MGSLFELWLYLHLIARSTFLSIPEFCSIYIARCHVDVRHGVAVASVGHKNLFHPADERPTVSGSDGSVSHFNDFSYCCFHNGVFVFSRCKDTNNSGNFQIIIEKTKVLPGWATPERGC